MSLWEVTGLAVALAFDCFSVCLGLGLERITARRAVRLSGLLGLAQGMLLIAGYLAAGVAHWITHHERVLAFAGEWTRALDLGLIHEEIHRMLGMGGALVLGVLGVKLVIGSLGPSDQMTKWRPGVSRPILLALAVNADSFTAGIGMGMLDGVGIPSVAIIMVAVGGLFSAVGLRLGRRLGGQIGVVAGPLGGTILIGIAVKFLVAAL